MPLSVTPLYASLIAIVFLILTARVIIYRRGNRISLGDAGDKNLLKRIRAQANCAELAPIGVLLLLCLELQGTPPALLHGLGLALLAGRIAHAIGFSRYPQIMSLRVWGMALTLAMLGISAVGLLINML